LQKRLRLLLLTLTSIVATIMASTGTWPPGAVRSHATRDAPVALLLRDVPAVATVPTHAAPALAESEVVRSARFREARTGNRRRPPLGNDGHTALPLRFLNGQAARIRTVTRLHIGFAHALSLALDGAASRKATALPPPAHA